MEQEKLRPEADECMNCGSMFQQGMSCSSGGAGGLAELCEDCDIRRDWMMGSRVHSTKIKEKNKSASISFKMLYLNIDKMIQGWLGLGGRK